jgi:CheY-like chemotaxis protein
MTNLSYRSPAPLSESPACDVMIVEDEPVSRRALLALVKAHGFASRAYPTAEEALKAVARDGVPAIALVDLHLPGMNGIEFIRRIEAARATVFPVLITAAGTDELDRVRQKRSVLCLRKPLDFPRLISLLREQRMAN